MKVTYYKGAPSLKCIRDLLGDLRGVGFGYYSHYFPYVTFSGRRGNDSLARALEILIRAGIKVEKYTMGDPATLRNGTIKMEIKP